MSFNKQAMLKAFQEIQEQSDNREKCVHNKVSKDRYLPWDYLNEEDWILFIEEVNFAWDSEQRKERNMRSYSEVEMEVWERWQKKVK